MRMCTLIQKLKVMCKDAHYKEYLKKVDDLNNAKECLKKNYKSMSPEIRNALILLIVKKD